MYFPSFQTDADTTSQPGVPELVDVLMNALETFEGQNTPSDFDFNTFINLAILGDA
jgi:hypothetical protein